MNWIRFTREVVTFAQPALNLLVLAVALRVGLSRRFPAVIAYLSLRFISTLSLLLLLHSNHFIAIPAQLQEQLYFYGFWATYVVCAIAVYFVVQEIFRELMRPVPDLGRLGMVAFRWVSIVSVLVTLAAVVLPAVNDGFRISFTTAELMRCISIMELCLLAFLALTVRSMGLSFRSPLFGIGLGFGLQALWELVMPVLALVRNHPLDSAEKLLILVGPMLAFLVWTGYFLVPNMEAELNTATLPVSSPLIRWNEIAKALGHNAPHVAVGPSQAFFLQDVEGVVDKVLTKNSISVNN